MSFLEIKRLRKQFGDVTPLRSVSFSVEKGEVVSIIGPSGTGKSTLIRCINRLETPSSGQILLEGKNICVPDTDLTALRRRVGMVFQSFNLFRHLTVLQNIVMPQMDILGRSAEDARKEALRQLRRVGLDSKAGSRPEELSGGQKQRAAIARALAMQPEIMLFDEPTSALDPTMVSEVRNVIARLASEEEMTMLIVTHEMRLARDVSTRVLFLNDGEIAEDGSPEQIFDSPLNESTRQFVMRVNSWQWVIDYGRTDFFIMMSSLEAFCQSRFMNRRLMNSCEMVVEELVSGHIQPCLKDYDEMRVEFRLETIGDNESVTLTAEFSGVDLDPFDEYALPMSDAIVNSKTRRVPQDGEGIRVWEIIV